MSNNPLVVDAYYHADALWSIIALTDENGMVVTRYNYTPFGEVEVIGEQSDNPFMFAAREYDPETGLLHERTREYSPILGRYISEDPIGFAGGDVNFYVRVGNNPVNFTDPLGLSSVAIPLNEVAPVLPSIVPILLNPYVLGAAVVVGVVLWPSELADPNECPMTPYQIYGTWLGLCLKNPSQLKWNQRRYGKKKDCGACYRECMNSNGNWPFYKCPG